MGGGLSQTLPGMRQELNPGSYVRVPQSEGLDVDGEFVLSALIWPTHLNGREQAILGRWSVAAQRGFQLMLTADGEVALRVGDGDSEPLVVRLPGSLPLRHWYRVEAAYCSREASVVCIPLEPRPAAEARALKTPVRVSPNSGGLQVYIAAWSDVSTTVGGHYNGKIERPRITRLGG